MSGWVNRSKVSETEIREPYLQSMKLSGKLCMENTKSWSVKPNSGLAVGTYVVTIKFSGTPEYSKYGGSSVEATSTVKFVVTEHDFDTSMWEYDTTKHWNPCKDTGSPYAYKKGIR